MGFSARERRTVIPAPPAPQLHLAPGETGYVRPVNFYAQPDGVVHQARDLTPDDWNHLRHVHEIDA